MATPDPRKVQGHRRNISSRSSLPRRPTLGPLDVADPLSPQPSTSTSTLPIRSPLSTKPTSPLNPSTPTANNTPTTQTPRTTSPILKQPSKDLSFLLRPENFHPLSQLDYPPPFRNNIGTAPPAADESLQSSLEKLDTLLASGQFIAAAQFATFILVGSNLDPNDAKIVFYLLYIRLACLELTGNTGLAAQESRVLEDLNSTFYYEDDDGAGNAGGGAGHHPPRHVVPWHLRVLALRLQSIGFGEPRRVISSLYELAAEARSESRRSGITSEVKHVWRERLADLGIRVVNALVEMGDLEAARRSLRGLSAGGKMKEEGLSVEMRTRLALLELQIGDVKAARRVVEAGSAVDEDSNSMAMMKPLLSMAEGRFPDAIALWRELLEVVKGGADEVVVTQNLAVCLLYVGKLNEALSLLTAVTIPTSSSSPDASPSAPGTIPFHSLIFNLCTLYELCTEKSRAMKVRLAEQIAAQGTRNDVGFEKANAVFKL